MFDILLLSLAVSLSPAGSCTAGSAAPGQARKDHETLNPLYALLRNKGVPITAQVNAPLPAPTMVDGLSSGMQQAVIKELLGEDIDYHVFTEDLTNAPPIQRPLRNIKGSNPQSPARLLDFYFIAYGTRKKLADKKFLERLVSSDRKKGDGKPLTTEDLKKRGITIAPESEKDEDYAYAAFPVMDRVEVRVVSHSYWTETAESLMLAGRIDDRFTSDADYPNQWRKLTKTVDGLQFGPPHPYGAVGYYMKVTQLKEPAGALFCEAHVIFTEPVGWFEGTNQLSSKLPSAVRDMVRKVRQELRR